MILRLFGARIGRDVHVFPTVKIAIPWNLEVGDQSAIGDGVRLYCLGEIRIGRRVTVSQGAHLCAGTHDYRRLDFALQKLPVTIEDGAWICADAFVGPDVTIGARAIIAARGVVTKDVLCDTIVGGNPAKFIKKRPPIT